MAPFAMDDICLNITGLRPKPPPARSSSNKRDEGWQRRDTQVPRARAAQATQETRQGGSSSVDDLSGKRELGGSQTQPVQPAKKRKRSIAGAARYAEALATSAAERLAAGRLEAQSASQKTSVLLRQGNESENFGEPPVKKGKFKRRKTSSAAPALESIGYSTPAQAPDQPAGAKVSSRTARQKAKLNQDVSAPKGVGFTKSSSEGTLGNLPPNADITKLKLHESLARQMDFLKFKQCTPIQALVIPVAMRGQRDILIRAPTGSGKTLAFLLPVLHQLLQLPAAERERRAGTLVLLLSPTKELALQTEKVAQSLLRMVPSLVCGSVAGGEKPKSEKARLRKGLNVLSATTGRLAYHLENSGSFVIASCRYLVLDEADRLLDLGFEPQIRRIYKAIAEARSNHAMAMEVIGRKMPDYVMQSVLVSATLTPAVKRLANFCLRADAFWADPAASTPLEGIDATEETEGDMANSIPPTLTQWYCIVPCKERLVALTALIMSRISGASHTEAANTAKKAIVFFSANSSVDFHHDMFKDIDWPSIHGVWKAPDSSGQRKTRKDKEGFVGYHDDQEDEEEESNDEEEEEEGQLGFGEDKRKSVKIFAELPLFKLHGSLDMHERAGYIHDFSSTTGGVLLASDAASRGLDFPKIDWIFQYDPPQRIEEYLHRIGRTARIGRSGDALLFLQPSEVGFLDVLRSHGVTNLKEVKASTLPGALLRCGAPDELSKARDFSSLLAGHMASHVASNEPLVKLARSAFLSSLRSYRTFPVELRAAFPFHELHTGHFASSFALRETPEEAARRQKWSSAPAKGKGKGKNSGKDQEGQSKAGSGQPRRSYRGAADEFAC